MTANELQAKLTEALGSSGAGLSDTMLQYAIDSALDDLARIKPKIGYELVTMISGKSEYSVPEGTYNVLDVVFPDIASYDGDSAWFQEFANIGDGDLSTFHSHSLAVIVAQKWEQLSSRFSYDWEYNLDTGKVLIMPTPSSNSKMIMKIAYKRTLEEVPPSLLQPIETLALSESLRMLATSVGGGITSVPIGIGNVSFSAAQLFQQANSLREEAIKKLGTSMGAGAVIIG